MSRIKQLWQRSTAGSITKLIGLFSTSSHLAYELDRVADSASTQPSLSDMTSKVIDVLSKMTTAIS